MLVVLAVGGGAVEWEVADRFYLWLCTQTVGIQGVGHKIQVIGRDAYAKLERYIRKAWDTLKLKASSKIGVLLAIRLTYYNF